MMPAVAVTADPWFRNSATQEYQASPKLLAQLNLHRHEINVEPRADARPSPVKKGKVTGGRHVQLQELSLPGACHIMRAAEKVQMQFEYARSGSPSAYSR